MSGNEIPIHGEDLEKILKFSWKKLSEIALFCGSFQIEDISSMDILSIIVSMRLDMENIRNKQSTSWKESEPVDEFIDKLRKNYPRMVELRKAAVCNNEQETSWNGSSTRH